MQKLIFFVFIPILLFFSFQAKSQHTDATTGATSFYSTPGNSLFHLTADEPLITGKLIVEGEIENSGEIDFTRLYKREVIAKESFINEQNKPEFKGVFRYKGYSLFDILNQVKVSKKNAADFRPFIDLYIVIENAQGDRAVFSWSEIYHTNIPHQIIIATDFAPIKPHRKEVTYKASEYWKIVAGNDLFSNRNIENPVKISVRSFDKKSYAINRDLDPLFSPEINVMIENSRKFVIPAITDRTKITKDCTSFFGMGMGFHGNKCFEGFPLNSLINSEGWADENSWYQQGMVCVASLDGYRAMFSFSELFNRNDQIRAILAIPEASDPSGYYRIFLPTDFYADRSVKAVREIYFFRD